MNQTLPYTGRVLNYMDCTEQDRAVHFAKTEKRERYELLKKRLSAVMNSGEE